MSATWTAPDLFKDTTFTLPNGAVVVANLLEPDLQWVAELIQQVACDDTGREYVPEFDDEAIEYMDISIIRHWDDDLNQTYLLFTFVSERAAPYAREFYEQLAVQYPGQVEMGPNEDLPCVIIHGNQEQAPIEEIVELLAEVVVFPGWPSALLADS